MSYDHVPMAKAYVVNNNPAPYAPQYDSNPPPAYTNHESRLPEETRDQILAREYAFRKFSGGGVVLTERMREVKQAPGISNQFNHSINVFGPRFWIVDNSGSMAITDGHVLIPSGQTGKQNSVACSRWEEIGNTVMWHAELAAKLQVPTEFRLLNAPGGRAKQVVRVGNGNYNQELDDIRKTMSTSPTSMTPLCTQIREVHNAILPLAQTLRDAGRKALVVVASDGASSDGDVAQALRMFTTSNLPVWVVVRLCTDDDAVVDYWNNIDSELELDMDVLDDVSSEANEVCSKNPWLTYDTNLHKLREWGTTVKEFDVLDERAFTLPEVRAFLNLIFGKACGPTGALPYPEVDFNVFEEAVDTAQKKCPSAFDPIKNKTSDWVDLKKLRKVAGKQGCSVM